MKTLYVLLIAVLLASCGPSAEQVTETAEMAQARTQTAAPTLTPTLTPTITPTSTPVYTPTPEFTDVYESKKQGISIRYPSDWNVSENGDQITIENKDKQIYLFFYPSEAQQTHNNDPVAALVSLTQFAGFALPDKEAVHIVELNGSEFAFGSYNNPGESPDLFYSPSPMFVAMRFTNKHTIAIEFDALPGEEDGNRKVLELILASLPPSPPRTAAIIPTLPPSDTLDLPAPPKGFNWQGVKNIEFALPVPDGWFVKFVNISETWQSGLQEYEYQYLITRDNIDYTGKFSNGMAIFVLKNKSINAANFVKDLSTRNEKDATKIIDEQKYTKGANIFYHLHSEGINDDAAPDDPDRFRTSYTVAIADTNSNIVYYIGFDTAIPDWEKEWKTGQVMIEMLLDYFSKP